MPDILSFLQEHVNVEIGDNVYMPAAIGGKHTLEGLHDLTDDEVDLVNRVMTALGQLESDDDVLSTLVALLGAKGTILLGATPTGLLKLVAPQLFGDEAALATSAFGKMVKSHGFDSIYYGLMHGPGWNVYHMPPPGQGGPQ